MVAEVVLDCGCSNHIEHDVNAYEYPMNKHEHVEYEDENAYQITLLVAIGRVDYIGCEAVAYEAGIKLTACAVHNDENNEEPEVNEREGHHEYGEDEQWPNLLNRI